VGAPFQCCTPHHIDLARREQLLPNLPAAFALLRSKYASDSESSPLILSCAPMRARLPRLLVPNFWPTIQTGRLNAQNRQFFRAVDAQHEDALNVAVLQLWE
jgi:hypothetical protein